MINSKILKDAVEHTLKNIGGVEVQALIELKMESSDNGYDIYIFTNILNFPYSICDIKIFNLNDGQSGISIKPRNIDPINKFIEDDVTLGIALRYLEKSVLSALFKLECDIISDAFSPLTTSKSEAYKKIEREITIENRDKKIEQYL